MNFIDTNYFLRFLLRDIPAHYTVVEELFRKAARGHTEVCTSTIVFFEINWVLSSTYTFEKDKLIPILKQILSMTFIQFDERDLLYGAVLLYQHTTLSLEDCYNLMYAKIRRTAKADFKTFDKKLSKVAERYL